MCSNCTFFASLIPAVRNDRSKKKKQKPESSSNISEELTEDDQMLLQEVLDAHRDTTPSSLSTGALSGSKTGERASTEAPLTSITVSCVSLIISCVLVTHEIIQSAVNCILIPKALSLSQAALVDPAYK